MNSFEPSFCASKSFEDNLFQEFACSFEAEGEDKKRKIIELGELRQIQEEEKKSRMAIPAPNPSFKRTNDFWTPILSSQRDPDWLPTQIVLFLQQQMKYLEQVHENNILLIDDLKKYYAFRKQITTELRLAELEARKEAGETDPSKLSHIDIINQPFLKVLTKNNTTRNSQNHWKVQLLSVLSITGLSEGQAIIIDESTKNSERKIIQGDAQNFDEERVAVFPIKFLTGTKGGLVHLKFRVKVVTTNGKSAYVESQLSNPFVVMTNESQWANCVRVLLLKECFPEGRREVHWPKFANLLQKFFVESICRPEKNSYPLSFDELNFFHRSFFESASFISRKSFEIFWEWFGPSMHRLRYQKNVNQLWKLGILHFLPRQDAENTLTSQPIGTCMIRFSGKQKGLFTCSFVANDKIRHYLEHPDDTSGKKSLANFLLETSVFKNLIIRTANNKYCGVEKESLLNAFDTRKTRDIPPGYDALE